MTLEQIRERLSDRNLREVARRVGLNYHTIRRVAIGSEHDPKNSTVEKLVAYFKEQGECYASERVNHTTTEGEGSRG